MGKFAFKGDPEEHPIVQRAQKAEADASQMASGFKLPRRQLCNAG